MKDSFLVPCARWAEKLATKYQDDLPYYERLALRNHLLSCTACAAAYASYQEIGMKLSCLPGVEYLDKKTIKEILAMGNKLGIFKDAKAVVYLEKLGKKDYDKCNKKELVNIFLQSGADLSGKVPDEILK